MYLQTTTTLTGKVEKKEKDLELWKIIVPIVAAILLLLLLLLILYKVLAGLLHRLKQLGSNS